MKWDQVQINKCVTKVNSINPQNVFGEKFFSYVDISSVDGVSKRISECQKITGYEAPSRARQQIKTGDIIISSVRPNLNAVAYVSDEYNNAIASTGFCVLRCDIKMINPKYLFYWVRSNSFVSDMVKKATGASYPAVSDTIIKQSNISLPPLYIQERVANTLDKVDDLRRKDRVLLSKYNELSEAIFFDMFGDAKEGLLKWGKVKLGEVCTKITDGEHGTVERQENGKLYLMARNIRDNFIDLDDVSYISEDDHNKIFKRCNPEYQDLLLVCVGATIGRSALVPQMEDFSLARSVALIKPDRMKLDPLFLYSFFKSAFMQKQIANSGNSSAQAGLYTGKIFDLEIFLPPISMQKNYSQKINLIHDLQKLTSKNLVSSNFIFERTTLQYFS